MEQNNQTGQSSGSHIPDPQQSPAQGRIRTHRTAPWPSPPNSSVGGQSNYSFYDPSQNVYYPPPPPPPPYTYSYPYPYPYSYPVPPYPYLHPPNFNFRHVNNPTTIAELDFNDDEPLQDRPAATTTLPNSGLKNVAIETSTEFPAVTASDSISSFAVLLGIHAPPLPTVVENQRVPIDLVAVLDLSGSMSGDKLSILKYGTKFVIDHMLPCDRLSIISFSTNARRILPLRRMTERGRKDAEFAVDQLRASGSTNIVAGLNMGAHVLEQRRQCNPVSSIIFLSDGQDTDNGHVYSPFQYQNTSRGAPGYLRLLSSSISSCNNTETHDENPRQRFPVYTFGVGMDHDAVAMNAIADGSCGTYSYVESPEMIPTSFARCIGGLFSVVAQDVRIMVSSASPGVEIKSIPSGRHANDITSQHKQGTIQVGDLFAEEKKEFLIYLSVPIHSHSEDNMVTENETIIKTPLLDIVCYYRNAFTDEIVQLDGPSIEILRPITPSPADKVVDLKVDGQRNRVGVAESIAKAKEMADKGNLTGAKEVLTSSRETLLASASAQSGVEMVSWLEAELKEITARMETMDLYDQNGRAFVLSGMSAHDAQRATSRNYTFLQAAASGAGASYGAAAFASAGAACGAAYDTPMMAQMQSKLQMPQPPKRQKHNGWRK